MILKKYGKNYQSVTPNFDSRAMTEIGFHRSEELSLSAEDFGEKYERLDTRELTAAAAAGVQDEAERALLTSLREQLEALEQAQPQDHVLVVENEQGKDYPKSREKTTTLVVAGENRLHFQRTIDPPLKIGVYAPRSR